MDQNIEFYGSDQIQTPQYPDVHPQSQETSDEVFQANHFIQNKESLENSSKEIAISNSNQEKEEPPQESEILQLIREECSVKVCEEQKQKQPAERGNHSIQSLQNFRVVHKNSISLNNTSQISSIHAIAPILSTKEPEHLLSMGYNHLSIIPETESDEVTESNAENLLPIPSECEVTLEDKRECDVPISENSSICDDHYDIFIDSKIDDDISVYDDDFEDIEYVEASLSDPKIVSVEEENVVHQAENDVYQEEEVDLEDISQIQDVVLREKLLSITRLISNIESLNDNPTPNRVLNSFESDKSLSDNFSPEFETFCDHSKETRSGNTTHADNSLLEYDSFCFEIEPDQERLINLVKNDISDDSSNNSLLEEADLFLSDNSIPPGIENFADDPEGDICFLEELLINDFILSHESSDSNFKDNPYGSPQKANFESYREYPDVHPPSQETSDEVFQANHFIQNKESLENSFKEIAISNSNQEKEEPPQESEIRQLIREECSVKVCEEQKQSMEDTMLELVKICQEKEFLCIHDNVDDLIESALNSKIFLINSNFQRLEKEQQEVKNVVEQPAERGNRSIQSLQNFRVVHKNSISLNNTSQISSIHAIAPILSTKEPEHLLSMGYEHLSITFETKSDEVTESNAENFLPILSECEVTLEDKRECDVPISENSSICDDHYDIFSDSKIDDDISVYDDDFEDIEYVEASLSDPEIVNVEEENVVHQAENDVYQEEEVDLEDISQIQDVVLREKLLSITHNFSPEFETFCDHSEETRSGNTTHADNSLPEYDSFCFEIEPDQERLINLVKNDISDDSSNNSILEEADLFLSDDSIPSGIENFADDPEGDIRFLEELLINDSILSHESPDSNLKDNPSIPRPPSKPPDAKTAQEKRFQS
nr:hypothetical protein [Tanacetum cinerariifolium]